MEAIDRNLVAAYLLVKGTPGIAKSKLYFTERGRKVVEWMLQEGYIAQKGTGCYLTEHGEEIGALWAKVAEDARQDEDIEQLIHSIEDRYNKRLALIKSKKE